MALTKSNKQAAKLSKEESELLAARNLLPALNQAQYLASGLSKTEHELRVSLGLVNSQEFVSSRSLAHILRSNILTLFNAVVGSAFIVLLVIGKWQDALFGIPVLVNILVGIGQELRSKRALDRLSLLSTPSARVRRSGKSVEIGLAEVVVDDLLEIKAGDQLVADAKIVQAQALAVDESLLSGEAEPIGKSVDDVLISGSVVISGSALAQVSRVGIETYSGRMSAEARRYSLVNSEIRAALNRIILVISVLLLPVTIVISLGQIQALGGWQNFVSGASTANVLVGSIASVVSMVPQGLVLITSIAFALAAIKLARRKVLIQELPAVETLARVDVICFDKTGTLTKGELTLRDLEVFQRESETQLNWESVLAHFAYATAANPTAAVLREKFPTPTELKELQKIEFDSSKKWSAYSFVTDEGNAESWVLGAPELLIDQSRFPDEFIRSQALASQGLRVLALLSSSSAELKEEKLPADLTPRVLVSIVEQIREDAIDTLKYFAEQNVSIRIISGDNPLTVAGIARAAGLSEFGKLGQKEAIDGSSLPTELSSLAEIMESNYIFGRVKPEQKRDMIRALQSKGHVVAMSGDGVNDALAIKQADLGIAMGSGSAASRAISRLVLLDGKFSSLASVVAEGRKVIANIELVARLFLTKTVWAMLLAIVFGLLAWRTAYLPRQITALDVFIIGIPSFALALLPNRTRYSPGFLRRTLSFAIPAGILIALSVVIVSFQLRIFELQTSRQLAELQTHVVLILAITGLWIVTTLSRPLDRTKLAILSLCYTIFGLTFAVPEIAGFFGFVSLELGHLAISVLVGLVISAVIELVQQKTVKSKGSRS